MKNELRQLRNVGKATFEDLELLGIKTVKQLASQDPTFLFHELERRSKKRHDPCVWDVFAAITHEASTGAATNWWDWTSKRKKLQIKHADEMGNEPNDH